MKPTPGGHHQSRYTLSEVLTLLDISYSRLALYRRELGEKAKGERRGVAVTFTAEQVEMFRTLHAQQPPREPGPFPGLTTADVSRRLELPRSLILRYARDLSKTLQLEKFEGRLVFTEEAAEEIRQHHEFRRESFGYRWTTEATAFKEVQSEIGAVLRSARKLVRNLDTVAKKLPRAQPSVLGFIHSLPDKRLYLRLPIGAILTPTGNGPWVASFPEAKLQAQGRNREEALRQLRKEISQTFVDLLASPQADPEVLSVLQKLIRVEEERQMSVGGSLCHPE